MYTVINMEGKTIIKTDSVPEVIDCIYNNEDAASVLKLGKDGQWHIDETDW